MIRIVSTVGAAALVLAALTGCSEPAPSAPAAAPAASEPAAAPATTPTADPLKPVAADPAAVEWAASMFPVFDTITQTGSGTGSFTLPAGVTAGSFALACGDENTVASVLVNGEDGSQTMGGRGGLGPEFSGTFGIEPNAPAAVVLAIESESTWTLTIRPISTLPGLATAGYDYGAYLYTAATDKPVQLKARSNDMLLRQYTDSVIAFVTPDGTSEGAAGTLMGTPSLVTVSTPDEWTVAVG